MCKAVNIILQEHKKVIERGIPEDAMPGIMGIKVHVMLNKIRN